MATEAGYDQVQFLQQDRRRCRQQGKGGQCIFRGFGLQLNLFIDQRVPELWESAPKMLDMPDDS